MTEELLHVDPATLLIGTNVRTDTQADAAEFAASIKSRGVLEVITAQRTPDGELEVLRGQRRTLVAAQVGTPTGTVPVRVIDPADDEAARIVDQLSENVHRAAMRDHEVTAAVAQLALFGVPAAQIARDAAIPRAQVDAALTVAHAPTATATMTERSLSLQDAALLAEFEDDADAQAELLHALDENRSLIHVAQQLRDTAAERAAVRARVEQLRAEGVPALTPAEVPANPYQLEVSGLVYLDSGDPVPAEDVAALPGAAVWVCAVPTWRAPFDDGLDADEDDDDEFIEGDDADDEFTEADDDSADEAPFELVERWLVLDPEAAGLVRRWDHPRYHIGSSTRIPADELDDETREQQRAERRRVIANNQAWDSATTVRREWLAEFLTRKTPPKGAEELIARAVLAEPTSLARAMQYGHGLLCDWLPGVQRGRRSLTDPVASATPKRQMVLVLGAVLAAWEDSLTRQSWRAPDAWNGHVLTALIGWGYQASDVEQLMIPQPEADTDDPDIVASDDLDDPAAVAA